MSPQQRQRPHHQKTAEYRYLPYPAGPGWRLSPSSTAPLPTFATGCTAAPALRSAHPSAMSRIVLFSAVQPWPSFSPSASRTRCPWPGAAPHLSSAHQRPGCALRARGLARGEAARLREVTIGVLGRPTAGLAQSYLCQKGLTVSIRASSSFRPMSAIMWGPTFINR